MVVKSGILLIVILTYAVDANEIKELQPFEARGKAKFALLIHFFYVVATKLFVLKLVYGAIFYALIVKGWHFFSWFIHYLKEKKHYKPEYGHIHYGQDYGQTYGQTYGQDYGHDYGYGQSLAQDSYGAYAYDKHSHGGEGGNNYDKKVMYDSDGSYSVKS